MRDAAPPQHVGKCFVLLDGAGAHQHRPALLMPLLDLRHDRLPLGPLVLEDHVGVILADHRLVRGDDDDREIVDLLQFLFLGLGRAGHAGQLLVHAEEVLEGDGRERLALPLHLHTLVGLDRLMQAVGVTATEHQPAGELVDDNHLAVLDDVVHVLLVAGVGPDGLLDVVHQVDVLGIGEVTDAEYALDLGDAFLGQGGVLDLLFDRVVRPGGEPAHDLGELLVALRRRLHHAGDDQRGARFVDEDEVHLVHDGVVEVAQDHVLHPQDHIVAQIVKAELVVRPVGDVGVVGLAPRHRPEVVQPVVVMRVGVVVGEVVDP